MAFFSPLIIVIYQGDKQNSEIWTNNVHVLYQRMLCRIGNPTKIED